MNLDVWSNNYQAAKLNFNKRIDLLKQKGLDVNHSTLDINEKDSEGNNIIDTTRKLHMFALEYASNQDLYEVLVREKYFKEDITKNIFKQLVDGLLYSYENGCDGNGISHRDIKLENIFVSKNGEIKIGDKLTSENIWVKRPGTGDIKAEFFNDLIGKISKKNIKSGQHINWDDFE